MRRDELSRVILWRHPSFRKLPVGVVVSFHNSSFSYNWFVRMKGYDYTQSLKNIAMIKALGYNESYKGYFEANIKIVKRTDITDSLSPLPVKNITGMYLVSSSLRSISRT